MTKFEFEELTDDAFDSGCFPCPYPKCKFLICPVPEVKILKTIQNDEDYPVIILKCPKCKKKIILDLKVDDEEITERIIFKIPPPKIKPKTYKSLMERLSAEDAKELKKVKELNRKKENA